MKNFKKILLILAAIMCFAANSCNPSEPRPHNSLVGQWSFLDRDGATLNITENEINFMSVRETPVVVETRAYQWVSADSIEVVTHAFGTFVTRSKVIFHTPDSVTLTGFFVGQNEVDLPIYEDVTLVRISEPVPCTENFVSISVMLKTPDGLPVLLDSTVVYWVEENRILSQNSVNQNSTWWNEARIYGNYVVVDDNMQQQLENRVESMSFKGFLNGETVCEKNVLVGANRCHVQYLGTEQLSQVIEGIPEDVVKGWFCNSVNSEHIREIIPSLICFLDALGENVSHENALQSVVDWLLSHNCITEAHVECVLCVDYYNEPNSRSLIGFSFEENGQTISKVLQITNTNHYGGLN
jgi:hypothetical protein